MQKPLKQLILEANTTLGETIAAEIGTTLGIPVTLTSDLDKATDACISVESGSYETLDQFRAWVVEPMAQAIAARTGTDPIECSVYDDIPKDYPNVEAFVLVYRPIHV